MCAHFTCEAQRHYSGVVFSNLHPTKFNLIKSRKASPRSMIKKMLRSLARSLISWVLSWARSCFAVNFLTTQLRKRGHQIFTERVDDSEKFAVNYFNAVNRCCWILIFCLYINKIILSRAKIISLMELVSDIYQQINTIQKEIYLVFLNKIIIVW